MKKLILSLMLATIATLNAQTVFTPGIKAGVNFAKFTESDSGIYNWFEANDEAARAEMSFLPGLYVGVQGNIRFKPVYALQPEIMASWQGSRVKYERSTSEPRVVYLSVQAINKFYYGRGNFQIGPVLDVLLNNKNFYAKSNTDLGLVAGFGYDINKTLSLEARAKKGLIPVATTNGEQHTNVVLQAGLHFNIPTKP